MQVACNPSIREVACKLSEKGLAWDCNGRDALGVNVTSVKVVAAFNPSKRCLENRLPFEKGNLNSAGQSECNRMLCSNDKWSTNFFFFFTMFSFL